MLGKSRLNIKVFRIMISIQQRAFLWHSLHRPERIILSVLILCLFMPGITGLIILPSFLYFWKLRLLVYITVFLLWVMQQHLVLTLSQNNSETFKNKTILSLSPKRLHFLFLGQGHFWKWDQIKITSQSFLNQCVHST